jgi:hypothetical protein
MDAVVAKPIEIARLFETMQQLLGEAEGQDVAVAAG